MMLMDYSQSSEKKNEIPGLNQVVCLYVSKTPCSLMDALCGPKLYTERVEPKSSAWGLDKNGTFFYFGARTMGGNTRRV